MIGLLIGFVNVYPGLAEGTEEGFSSNANTVQGFIDSIGKDFILINGKRLRFSPNALFFDEEGGKIIDGRKRLRPEMRVDLRLDKDEIVEATIYGLLMR